MNRVYFFTGFPGFLATRLIRRLAAAQPEALFYALVHPSQLERARREAGELAAQIVLLTGDITRPQLGLGEQERQEVAARVTHVFHLAAIYDLAVPYDLAYQVNVTGTGHVNDWVQGLSQLERYVYFSTAYVSGTRKGRIFEHELQEGQSFKNHYESTKYEAEVLVQAIRPRVPTTIIRPGIVMGDSQTGETVKFDGPYFVMRFLDKFARLPIPYIGKGEAPINLVPVDYIVEATVWLAHAEQAVNEVYHLTDPTPHAARDVYKAICHHLVQKQPTYTLPAALVAGALAIGPFRRFVGVEQETVAYFDNLAVYDSTAAQRELATAGIRCPDFYDYVGPAVAFYQQHRADPEKRILVR